MIQNLYHYRAIFKSNYDGDTITVDIDLGMNVWLKDRRVRLFGINTQELRSKDPGQKALARQAKEFVSELLFPRDQITIKTHKDESGKFGRLLATVYTEDNENVNEMLVSAGLAEVANY